MISQDGIRILKFTTGYEELEAANGLLTNEFYASKGDNYKVVDHA